MKKHHILYALLAITAGCQTAGIYVSPIGNDQNPGTKSKPFQTIHKAQHAAAKLLKTNASKDVNVWLADGTYYLSEALEFDSSVSGKGENFVSFKAEPGANPVISGGIEITGWEPHSDGIWKAKAPADMGKSTPRELFVNGARYHRARHPNQGYIRVKEAGTDRRTNFRYYEGDFPHPQKLQKVELVLLHDWSITRIPVKEIDTIDNRITAVDSIGAKMLDFFNIDGWEKNPRYFLENDMAFLDSPGEWFQDSIEQMIYVQFPADMNPSSLKVVMPVTGPHLLVFNGLEQSKVRNVIFDGISFEHCAWQLPAGTYPGIQACHFDSRIPTGGWRVVPAAIYSQWAENITFNRCKFSKLGGSGLWFATGCNNCTVSESDFTDISGNAIMIGEGSDRRINGETWWKVSPDQAAQKNNVINNTISDCGKQFYGAVGVWCGFTAGTTISGNHIFNLPYTGISVGWEWSPVPTPCRENHISDNHIHHIMQILSDGGGIYMLGLQPGSTITGNLIHDVSVNAGRAESNGMFLDEGITDVVVSDNIIYNIARSPLRFHRATTNLVKENILSCGDDIPPVRYNNTREEDILLENNLILKDSDPTDKIKLDEAIAKWQEKSGKATIN